MTNRHALLLALLVGAVLRLAGLGERPAAFHPDEAIEAYEAWSLGTTGRAADGRRFPLAFDNHGAGWAEGTYTWLAVAPVRLIGRAGIERAARLPAAVAGVVAIAATFFLATRLLGPRAGALAALLVATEPIAVHFSRVALRASLEPAFLSVGLALATAGLDRAAGDRRGALLALAGGLVLALGVLTYPPARVVLPVVACAFAAALPSSRERKAALLVPVLAALVAVTPFALSPEGRLRLQDISVLNAPGAHDGGGRGPVLDSLRGYLLHFAPRTLLAGDFARGFWATGVPPLLALEVPFLLVGVLGLARAARGGDRRAGLVLALLLAAPLASAVTRPSPNLIRAIFLVPAFALAVAAGIDAELRGVEARAPRLRGIALALLVVLWLVSVAVAARRYAVEFPSRRSAWTDWTGYAARVERLSGPVKLDGPLERALVDLYARDRERRFETRQKGWLAPPR